MKRSLTIVAAVALLLGTAYARKPAHVVDVAAAFAQHLDHVRVEDAGEVVTTLRDDTEGSRHQRFLVRVVSGTTVLIAHNIDIAPRVAPLHRGDRVTFNGEYVWNAKGGVVHWTHHDPSGRHLSGWVRANGKTFQ